MGNAPNGRTKHGPVRAKSMLALASATQDASKYAQLQKSLSNPDIDQMYMKENGFIIVNGTLEKESPNNIGTSHTDSECALEVDDMEAVLQDCGALEVDVNAVVQQSAKMGSWTPSTEFDDHLSSLAENTPTQTNFCFGGQSYDDMAPVTHSLSTGQT
jgi:hypothetical protein